MKCGLSSPLRKCIHKSVSWYPKRVHFSIKGVFLVIEPKGASGLLRGLGGGSRSPPAVLPCGHQMPRPNAVPAG